MNAAYQQWLETYQQRDWVIYANSYFSVVLFCLLAAGSGYYVYTNQVAKVKFCETCLLKLIIMLGLAMRLLNLGGNSLWFDEALSAFQANADFSHMLQSTLAVDHPPLYFTILWAWLRLFPLEGHTVWLDMWLRLPSVAFGTANIGLMWLVARAFQRPKFERLMSTFFMAAMPFQLWYSQEARMYELLLSGFMVALYGYKTERWWLFSGGGLATLYTQNLGGALGLGSISLVVMLLERKHLKQWLRSNLFMAIGYSPWAVFGLSQQLERVSKTFWIPPITPAGVGHTFFALLWSEIPQPNILTLFPGVAITLLIIALSVWHGWKQDKSLVMLALLPVGLNVLISIGFVPALLSRVVITATPGLYLLLAMLTRQGRKWIFASLMALLIINLGYFYLTELKFPSRDYAAQLDAFGVPVVYTVNAPPLMWYQQQPYYALPVLEDDFTAKFNLTNLYFEDLGIPQTNLHLSNLKGQQLLIFHSLGPNTPLKYQRWYDQMKPVATFEQELMRWNVATMRGALIQVSHE